MIRNSGNRWLRARPFFMGLAALLLACSIGTATPDDLDPSLDLWPMLRLWSPPLKLPENHGEAIYPVVEWHNEELSSKFFLRPLYSRRDDKFNDVVEWDLLWPFVFGTERPDLRRIVVFPLFVKDTLTSPEGEETSRTILLPLYYRKSVEKEGVQQPRSLLFFPFGGVLHDFLGRNRIVVAMWPLYVKQESKTATSWSVLHPIFAWVRWEDGGRGWKVWPLFGVNRRPDRMRAMFVLWPIYHDQWAKTELGEFKRRWIFPFYGKIEEPGGWEWAVLWPFFSGRYEKAIDQTTYWYPWPFLGHRTGAERDGVAFWPIYRTSRSPDRRNTSFLWPFGWYRHETPRGADNVSFRITPLMFYQRERLYESAAGETVDETRAREERPRTESGGWQLWPLIRRRWNHDGSGDLELLSLMPLRNYGPWERNFAPFFRLFQYQRDADGARSWRVLWRLVRVDRGPKESYTAVRPLFSARSRTADPQLRRWNVLGGLLGLSLIHI